MPAITELNIILVHHILQPQASVHTASRISVP